MKTKVFLILLLLTIFNIGYSQVPSYVPMNGLVGYWPFNGNANDVSGNGNNGIVNGATLTTDRFGNINSAYSFNGSSDYIILQNCLLSNQQSYSINLWTKIQGNQTIDLFNDRQEPSCYYKYRILVVNGVIQFWKYTNNSLEKVIGNALPLNQWVMITAVFDNNQNTIKIYTNSLLNSTSSSLNWNASQNSTTIGGLRGCNTFGTYNIQNGPIDDIGVWNYALSEDDINSLYNVCFTNAPTGNSYQTLCANSTLNDVQVTGSNIQYYDAQTGGNLLPNTGTLINGQIVYASQTINGCESNDRLAITISINDPQIVASSTNVCVGTSVNLTASTTSNLASNCALPSNLQNGLVGYWPFCGNANDTSGNENNGTVNGASLTTDRFGNSNSAYNFDGISNNITLPIQQNGITNYSISSWFKTSFGGAVLSGRGTSNQVGLTLDVNNIATGGTINNGKVMFVADGPAISIGNFTSGQYIDNQWHHVVGVFSGAIGSINSNQFAIYIDGILANQFSNTTGVASAPINNLTNLLIGSHQIWPSGGYFNGLIDDLGIWNRALSQQEILQLYNQGQTTYLWSTGETSASINPSPNTTTIYWCDVTTNGVTCHKEITITVNQPLTPTFNQVASVCESNTISPLPTSSNENISGTWSPAINNTASTTYTFTPDFGQCASASTMTIEVNPNIIPTFNQIAPICSGTNLHVLPSSSLEGVTGIWSPMIDNTTTTTYTFTPTLGQCALSNQMTIVVNPNVIPTFNQIAPICMGTQLNDLPTISIENITGLWSPSIDNNVTTTYTFTPTIGQCALSNQMTIVVNPNITPTFNQVAPICNGTPIDALPNISNENISGSWSPTIDNSNTTTYLFTPTTGQCAIANQMTIVVYPIPTIPSGASNQSYNDGDTLSNLAITGTNLNWYDSQSSDTPINISTPLVNGTTYYVSQTINGCEGPRLAVTVTLTLSLHQNQIFNLSYNPNPVEDMLWIKSNNIIKNVSVYNLLGQLLLSDIKETNEFSIDLSNLPSSNYFIKVETENAKQIFKIIKK